MEKMHIQTGVTVPESIGNNPDCMKYLWQGLADRNIHIKETVTKILKREPSPFFTLFCRQSKYF